MWLAELNFYCFEYIKLVEVITKQREEKGCSNYSSLLYSPIPHQTTQVSLDLLSGIKSRQGTWLWNTAASLVLEAAQEGLKDLHHLQEIQALHHPGSDPQWYSHLAEHLSNSERNQAVILMVFKVIYGFYIRQNNE